MREILKKALPYLSLLIFGLCLTYGTFVGGAYAGIAIAGGLLAALCALLITGHIPWPGRTETLFVASFTLCIAALNLQSLHPQASWFGLLQLLSILIPLLLFSNEEVQWQMHAPGNFTLVALAAVLAAIALSADIALSGPLLNFMRGKPTHLAEYNRGACYLAVMVFPLAAHLWERRRALLPLFIAGLLPITWYTQSGTATLALLAGIVVTLAAAFLPRLTCMLLVLCAFLMIAMPFAAHEALHHHRDTLKLILPSWEARVEIWDFMSYRIVEHPWLGRGFDTTNLIRFSEPHDGAVYHYISDAVSHPHNSLIQLWAELGLPGLAFGLFFALLMLWRALRLPKPLSAFAVGAWTAAFSASLTAYRLWDDAMLALFALTALSFALLRRERS